MGILNSSQIKSLKRMNKYLSEMSEATTDLSNDCTKISTNWINVNKVDKKKRRINKNRTTI